MQKNIDQQFQEAIGKLEGDPQGVTRNPEASWDTIGGMLNNDKRRRRGAWLWIAAAASVAILITLGFWWMPDRETSVKEMAVLNSHSGDSIATSRANPLPVQSPDTLATVTEEGEALKMNEPENGRLVNGKFMATANATTAPANAQRIVMRGGNWMNSNLTAVTQQEISSTAYTYNWTPGTTADLGVASSPTNPILTFGGTPGLVTPNQATNQFRWDFGNGATVNGQTPATVSGTYTVVVTDANGANSNPMLSGKKGLLDTKTQSTNKGYFALSDSISFIPQDPYGAESYAETVENPYFMTTQEPLSTFSIDVDRASYTNHRRYVESGELPPKYAVRAEEFINYFDYNYAQPRGGEPFSILPEVTTCPWNPQNKLVRIALKGREVSTENVPPSNIVFLLDVSGSMSDADKLPLLKQAMGMLTDNLREQDKVSIVVYAGAAGLVLPPTSGVNKAVIMNALDRLEAGGSTAGGEGIELAYATARQNFIKEGNNRVILATDGDFNVGTSDEAGLERLIVKKREEGVFLSVLGFGEGNLQDSKMELLADKGNGNYNYIDSDREAHKVLVSEFGGTLYTIAKDVKIQVEFNPAKVQSYRLVGYENRKLRNEDFANDQIDAGELGAGHTVTALYEIVPTPNGWSGNSQDLKYQTKVLSPAANGNELITVKLRYKDPNGSVSKLLTETLVDDGR
ncbi:MAG TPA: von Willebrand factor type A domain-containing protein, partial [Bacteroidia bacterium]|nr:von Willebrand factor type A domain-containing protein [Bacteroidia bacterium]